MLDLALLGAEVGAQLLHNRLVRGGTKLGLELRAQQRLLLGDELRADVRPRGRVRRLDRELGGGEVADLDLRLHCDVFEKRSPSVRTCAHPAKEAKEVHTLLLDHWEDSLVPDTQTKTHKHGFKLKFRRGGMLNELSA